MVARYWLGFLSALLALGMAVVAPARAQGTDTVLTVIDATGKRHTFTPPALLGRGDATTIHIPRDVSYGNSPSTYRAVPLASLLGSVPSTEADVLMATALDGFVAQLPLDKLMNTSPAGALAYLAIEDRAAPWPNLPRKDVSAGPFYIVWVNPERSGIRPEAWPFQTVRLELKESVERRYPAILVAPTLPQDAPARRGQALFVENCFVCHKMNGAGDATMAPDLNLPMNPTEYFRAEVLPRYLRNPASVRHWPNQAMPGFAENVLSDRDIGDIVAYLAHMAGRKARP